jgi:hypothetical protein
MLAVGLAFIVNWVQWAVNWGGCLYRFEFNLDRRSYPVIVKFRTKIKDPTADAFGSFCINLYNIYFNMRSKP